MLSILIIYTKLSNSNTTLVKVKLHICFYKTVSLLDSNTTLVKVKCTKAVLPNADAD